MKVLEEIDRHKKRQDSVGFNARLIIKHLDSLRGKGSLHKGVRIEKGKGILKVSTNAPNLPPDLDPRVPDHQILSTAIRQQEETPKRKVIVVSRDINMRVICDSVGLLAEDYISEKAVLIKKKLYCSFFHHKKHLHHRPPFHGLSAYKFRRVDPKKKKYYHNLNQCKAKHNDDVLCAYLARQ